jgi:hypothetical protein
MFGLSAARVKGTQWLNWLHLKERNNLTKGTNKNKLKVLGRVEPQVGWTSNGTPLVWVGCGVIAARRSGHTNTRRAWLDTATMLVNFGRRQTGRNSGAVYSAYKCECGKLFEQETSEKLNLSKS